VGAQEEHDTARHRFDVADAAPLLLDAHGTVTGWTKDAERLLDYPATEAVGRSVAALLTPEDARRLPEITARCRTDGSWAGLLTALHRHGQPVPVMVRITVADDSDDAER
jgi:PAS domain S-box-containing protein